MAQTEIALMAHQLRRTGFGTARDELEQYVAQGYEATVEELLHPEEAPPALEDEDFTPALPRGPDQFPEPSHAQPGVLAPPHDPYEAAS